MKIVNFRAFVKLPEGTVYSRYEPSYFRGLEIKGETIMDRDNNPIDFFYQDLIEAPIDGDSSEDRYDILDVAVKEGKSFKLDLYCGGRDGSFDDSLLFAIYEDEDVYNLIIKLKNRRKEF